MEALAYFAKKTISVVFDPVGTSLVLFMAALVCLHRKNGRRVSVVLVGLGIVWLCVTSLPVVGRAMLHPLESRAGGYADPVDLRRRGVTHIVVLGADAVSPELSPADRQGAGIHNIMEGIRLWKELPESRLVISAGSSPDFACDVEAVAALPLQLGVYRRSLIIDNSAWDTEAEARRFSRMVGSKPFALVTTATHMPRSLMLFRRYGTDPVPCPCVFKSRRQSGRFTSFLPGAGGLGMTDQAMHEYVGIAWLHMKGLLRGTEPHTK